MPGLTCWGDTSTYVGHVGTTVPIRGGVKGQMLNCSAEPPLEGRGGGLNGIRKIFWNVFELNWKLPWDVMVGVFSLEGLSEHVVAFLLRLYKGLPSVSLWVLFEGASTFRFLDLLFVKLSWPITWSGCVQVVSVSIIKLRLSRKLGSIASSVSSRMDSIYFERTLSGKSSDIGSETISCNSASEGTNSSCFLSVESRMLWLMSQFCQSGKASLLAKSSPSLQTTSNKSCSSSSPSL